MNGLELREVIERELRSGGAPQAVVVFDAPLGFGLRECVREALRASPKWGGTGVRWIRSPDQVIQASGLFVADGNGAVGAWCERVRNLSGLAKPSSALRVLLLREQQFEPVPPDARQAMLRPVPVRDLVLLEREQLLEALHLGPQERARVEMALWGAACLSGGRPAVFRRLFEAAFAVSDVRSLVPVLVQEHSQTPTIASPDGVDPSWAAVAAWDGAARRQPGPKGALPRHLDNPLRGRLVEELLGLELAVTQVLRSLAGWNGVEPAPTSFVNSNAERVLAGARSDRFKVSELAQKLAGLKYRPATEHVLGIGQWLALDGITFGARRLSIPPGFMAAFKDVQQLRNYVVHGHPITTALLSRVFEVTEQWESAIASP